MDQKTNLPDCPICGGVELEIGIHPLSRRQRIECPCGVSGVWGQGLSGAIEGWARLTGPIAQMRALVHLGDMAAGQSDLDKGKKRNG